MNRIRAALQALLDSPDPWEVSSTDPLHEKEAKERAEGLVAQAADFVQALREGGHFRELHTRVRRFARLTGENSSLDKLRRRAHKRIRLQSKSRPPDAERLSLAEWRDFPSKLVKASGAMAQHFETSSPRARELAEGLEADSFWNDPFNLRFVSKFFGDSTSLSWFPYEVERYCWELARMPDGHEMGALATQLRSYFERGFFLRLWGSFLLEKASDMRLRPADERRLATALTYSEKASAALKDAAKDLVKTVPVAGEQTPTTAEKHAGEGTTHGEVTPVVRGAAAPKDKKEKPHWDAGSLKLWYKGRLIKKFHTPAETQTVVLAAFEEEGWPDLIDDPLPPKANLRPKRRVRQTVIALNDSHKTKRQMMYFTSERFGEAIGWHDGAKCRKKLAKKPIAKKPKA